MPSAHDYIYADLEARNIHLRHEDNKLIFEVDLTRNLGPSKSGKSINIASTPGQYRLGKYGFGLQVWRVKLDKGELSMPDMMWAEPGTGLQLLEDIGENLSDWSVQHVVLDNGRHMDCVLRRKAWQLLKNV